MKDVGKVLKILEKTNHISMLGEFNQKKYNPWKVLIGTILSARCTDEVTYPVSEKLFKAYPTPKKLAEAKPSDVQKIIKPIGFYKNKTKFIIETSKRVVKDGVPKDMKGLVSLPGVGNKVACCVLVYAYSIPEIPVDTHVAVVANRLGWTDETEPDKIWVDLKAKIPKKYWLMVNELFVVHGKHICFKRAPKCDICPVSKYCRYFKEEYKHKI